MKTIEQQYKLNEQTYCSYCGDEKKFLMVKPLAMAFDGEIAVNVNKTNKTLWTCLECLSLDIDAMGHSVDICEFNS